jgi:ABC-type antimicrobial peptide transport system permease subunit
MRAIGFGRRQIGVLLGTEAAILGLCGSGAALLLSFPVVESWVSDFAGKTMYLPPLHIHLIDALTTLSFGTLLGLASASLSIRRTFELKLADALRHVD